jgi:glycosyltransferase involved in cell wall biosynthesis
MSTLTLTETPAADRPVAIPPQQRPAKLLMISNYFESHCGGLDLIAGRLVRELLRLGQNVRWFASSATPAAADPELAGRTVAVRMLNATERYLGIPYPFPGARALWRLGREVRGSDAVLLQDSLYPICVAAFLLARLWAKPVIIAQHVGIVPYRNPVFRLLMSGLNRIVARPMLAHADQVAIFSEITARYFSSVRFRRAPRRLFTGVDTDLFRPAEPEQKAAIRHRLGLDPDRPLALFVGRFVEKKGMHILERMARQRPDITWVFAGWGHLDPSGWSLPNVVVRTGLSGATLTPLYQASDVFVLPSKGDGFPLVIQEAIACGLPVVCSADTATADPEVSRFLSAVELDEANPDATATAFCQAVDRTLGNDQRAAAQQRFDFVVSRYSWSGCAAEYLALIRGCLPSLLPAASASRQTDRSRPMVEVGPR